MSKQLHKNTATDLLCCFGSSDASSCDVSGIARVLKSCSGGAMAATMAVTVVVFSLEAWQQGCKPH